MHILKIKVKNTMRIGTTSILIVTVLLLLTCQSVNASWQEELQRGIQEYRSENYEEAFEHLYRARQQNRASSVVAFYLGLTYKQIGDYQRAAEYFEDAVRLQPPVVEAYGELIEMLYSLDKTKEALQWITKAESLSIEPAKISFLKGLVYSKTNDFDRAIEAFQRAKQQDPSTTQAADLQIAIAYAKQRKISKAIQSLKAVVSANPNTDIAQFAREYEEVFVKSIEAYRPLRLSAAISYVYDTNVTAKPSTDIGLPPSNSKDGALMGNLNINFTPLTEGNIFFSASYAFSGTFYHKLTDYNAVSNTLSLTPGYNFNWLTLSLPVSYSHNLLNGKGYMSTASVRPTVSLISQSGLITNLSAGYTYRNMLQTALDPDEDRDAKQFHGGIGILYPFGTSRGMLSMRYEFIKDDTKGANWKNNGNRFNLSLIIPLHDKVDFMLAADAYLQNYKKEHTIFLVKRNDKTYTLNAAIAYEFIRNLYANAQLVHTVSQSNIPLYDYKKTTISAGLEYRF